MGSGQRDNGQRAAGKGQWAAGKGQAGKGQAGKGQWAAGGGQRAAGQMGSGRRAAGRWTGLYAGGFMREFCLWMYTKLARFLENRVKMRSIISKLLFSNVL